MIKSLRDLIVDEVQPYQPTSILANNLLEIPDIYSAEYNRPKANWLSNFGRNFAQGYRENYDNRFNMDNLTPNENKNWQTRIGEGLGTVGRFLDSPWGRGLLTAGLVGATGGSGLQALSFGAGAGVKRQEMQTADKVYRKQLKQMGYTDDELDNIQGDISPTIYKGLADSLRLGNQRMTYGQLALFDNDIAELLRTNPELENQFIPLTMARDIYTKRKQKAEADIEKTIAGTEKTKADTEGSIARTEKTKKETEYVGKPRVTINRREGGTTSTVNIRHTGGSVGKGGKTTTTNKTIRPIGQNIKEGTIIKNKQGKRMILRGGKWQPM